MDWTSNILGVYLLEHGKGIVSLIVIHLGGYIRWVRVVFINVGTNYIAYWFFFSLCWRIDDGARGIVEMLFCTSLIVLVGAADQPQSSPRKLQIVNTKVSHFYSLFAATTSRLIDMNLFFGMKRQSMICELLFPSSILAVKLNRKSLVIVLEMEIYVYDISNMRLLHVIETTPNPEGMS